MISCHSVQRIQGLDFSSYLLLPQYSHSYLKYENSGFVVQKKATDKMLLGSFVDAILTGGDADMSHPIYPIAKNIAAKLKAEFGLVLHRLQKQVSYTSIMRLDLGKAIFELPVKGRTDYVEQTKFVLDLKITNEQLKNIDKNMHFMGYPNQGFCYCKLDGSETCYFLIYSTKDKCCTIKRIPIGDTNKFWEEKIIKFGKAI